jgi:hypothetical protein
MFVIIYTQKVCTNSEYEHRNFSGQKFVYILYENEINGVAILKLVHEPKQTTFCRRWNPPTSCLRSGGISCIEFRSRAQMAGMCAKNFTANHTPMWISSPSKNMFENMVGLRWLSSQLKYRCTKYQHFNSVCEYHHLSYSRIPGFPWCPWIQAQRNCVQEYQPSLNLGIPEYRDFTMVMKIKQNTGDFTYVHKYQLSRNLGISKCQVFTCVHEY